MMKKFFCVLACLFSAFAAFAQSGQILKVVLADSADGSAVGFATVSITPEGAEKPSKYLLTNDKGEARFEGVKKGNYTVRAELMGYKTYESKVTVADKPVDLGTVKLEADTQLLEAATVTDVGNPIVVKKDTIEYNASSFRITDNDMLEDLLKKLPGVEVSSDGSITANGQTISKITIDGKTFFLDDPSLASKNIPAKMVQKVKVVEKKSDQAIFTGIDDGEEETVIDLSLHPGMMKGWFGNVMGGGGHDLQTVGMGQDARWQGAAMVGRFTDKSQISLILNANNTNNRGFNDMAGSMMQSMRGGSGGMGRGSGGFGGDNGIMTSWMGGVNGAFTLCDGDMDLGTNYLYNGSIKYIEEESRKTTYLDDGSSLLYNNNGTNNTMTQGHRFGVRLEHKFSEKTSILFEPQVNFGQGTFNEWSADSTSRNSYDNIINRGFSSNSGDNKNWTASGFLLFRQRLNKPGRTISANVRYSFSGNTMNGFNQSLTQSANELTGLWEGDPTNQRYLSTSNGSSVNTRVSYTEPLTEKLFLEATYSYGWNLNKSNKDVYDSGLLEDGVDLAELVRYRDPSAYSTDGEAFNSEYSSDIRNQYQNHRAGANLQWQNDKLRLQIGAAYQPTVTDNVTNGETYHSLVHNWSPQAMVNWELDDNTDFRMFYRGRSSQPSTSQLMPVPDNSDPLNISFGNPNLTPYFSHNIRGMFGHTNKETFFSIHGHYSASIVQSGITNASWYDNGGVQYSMPLNGPVTGNANLGFFLNSPIAKSNFSLSNMFNTGFSQSTSYVGRTDKGQSDKFTNDYYTSVAPDFDYEKFSKDYDEFVSDDGETFMEYYFMENKTSSFNFMERFKATFRNDFVEISASARTSMNKAWYTMEGVTQKATWNNQASCEMIWTVPGGFGIDANYNYNWYNGYTTEQPDEHILNVEISQLIFKNQFTLAIKAYDLLNQSKNLSVTDSANYHQEIRNNTLGRYVIVSLTYRFGNFGKAGKQMESKMKGRGPMGGPMGPPPGR